MKTLFTPLSILAGLLAGKLASTIAAKIWAAIDDEEAPEPKYREIAMVKLIPALLIEGAVLKLTKGLVDHGLRHAFARGRRGVARGRAPRARVTEEPASVANERRPGRGGLVPLVAGVLALVVIAAIVVGLVSCNGDDDDSDAAAPPAPSGTGTLVAGQGTTIGEESLLGDNAVAISSHIDEQAMGRGIAVVSVTQAGFFVGTSQEDRQYVEYSNAVGGPEPGIGVPMVGERVDLQGPIELPPQDTGRTLRLEPADSAQVDLHGGYINAQAVTRSP